MKVHEGNYQQLSHHGLIRIIIEYSLQNLIITITLEIFKDMPIEEDIKALVYDRSPTVSEKDEEETETNKEEEERNEEEIDEVEKEEKEKEKGSGMKWS